MRGMEDVKKLTVAPLVQKLTAIKETRQWHYHIYESPALTYTKADVSRSYLHILHDYDPF